MQLFFRSNPETSQDSAKPSGFVLQKLTFLALILLSVFLVSCGGKTTENENLPPAKSMLETENDESVSGDDGTNAFAEGLKVIDGNCISCHSTDASLENRVAPPLVAVKMHYKDSTTTEEEFVSAMTSFLQNPNKEQSKMPGAVDRFGVMPNLGFPKEKYEAVALYLYNTEIEAPDWFEEHYQEEKKKWMSAEGAGEESYVDRGLNFALATKSVLGKNLLGAINTRGPAGAVTFCNTRAIPLVDSMSTDQGAKIKRVSDKNRNPNNAANEMELAYIKQAKQQLANGEEITPETHEMDNSVIGYYPILTNDMCMKCHGDPKTDIDSETFAEINSLYPKDKATGYKVNQLRGIWVVEMAK